MDLSTVTDFLQANQLAIIFVLAVTQLITLLFLLIVWQSNRKRYVRLQPLLEQADATSSIAANLTRQQHSLAELESALQSVAAAQVALEEKQTLSIQRIGYYRYNAFPGTGGELSFSLALLDGDQAGFVLTSLYGRQDARVYAKQVNEGSSAARLSPEEYEAIRRACPSKKFCS